VYEYMVKTSATHHTAGSKAKVNQAAGKVPTKPVAATQPAATGAEASKPVVSLPAPSMQAQQSSTEAGIGNRTLVYLAIGMIVLVAGYFIWQRR
jgi:hypothetical protein